MGWTGTALGFRTAVAAAAALATVVVLAALGGGEARGERTQKGNLIASLDGGLHPLRLPRDQPAPVAVRLEGRLRTADGEILPRATRIEIGLPSEARISAVGLPVCALRALRDASSEQALRACRGALVGRGILRAFVVLPRQAPFELRARLLAFNARVGGRRGLIVHGVSSRPPTVAVIPFVLRRGKGRFGTVLRADLPRSLGPWPRFAHFELTLSRRYRHRGRARSYVSASCPIPPGFTAGFFSFARIAFDFADGRRVGTAITRSCRAR